MQPSDIVAMVVGAFEQVIIFINSALGTALHAGSSGSSDLLVATHVI
ncbi:MAG: hypothetical protein Q3962_06795 [Corynebacterium sp.]|nr:hypothetical protein [Corynebacterium sp.]